MILTIFTNKTRFKKVTTELISSTSKFNSVLLLFYKGRLVGDVLLATGFLSYCGPYNQEFRANLVDTWMDILKTREIPYTKGLNITNMLVESATVSEWTLQGLPNDELSVQNALIATKSRSYPLLIDPQSQGKMWIKNKEANNNLQITSLEHKYFKTHLEDCLSLGRYGKGDAKMVEAIGTLQNNRRCKYNFQFSKKYSVSWPRDSMSASRIIDTF